MPIDPSLHGVYNAPLTVNDHQILLASFHAQVLAFAVYGEGNWWVVRIGEVESRELTEVPSHFAAVDLLWEHFHQFVPGLASPSFGPPKLVGG